MEFPGPLIKARLIKRYKRFLADVELTDGRQMTIHTANTGSMSGCAIPGSTIWISDSQNPKRKYPYSWEISTSESGERIGINTLLANKLVQEAIENGDIDEVKDFIKLETEVPYGMEKSRIDLLLTREDGQKCYIEVKNVTASFESGIAAFPDAVTTRGSKHLRELQQMVQKGARAIILFCVQREDIRAVRPAREIDPLYAETLHQVQKNGVEVLAYGVDFSGSEVPSGIRLKKKLPVLLHA